MVQNVTLITTAVKYTTILCSRLLTLGALSSTRSHLGYERVYLPLYKVADTPFHIQGGDRVGSLAYQNSVIGNEMLCLNIKICVCLISN